MLLGELFPEELKKKIKPSPRGFYCDKKSKDLNTGEIKAKYQIYCDFISEYVDDCYIFIITTSQDYTKNYDKYYEYNTDSDINLLDSGNRRFLEDKGYIYPRDSLLAYTDCKIIRFPKHIKNNRFVHFGHLNSRKYKELRSFLKDGRMKKNLDNKLNLLTSIEFESEEKSIKVEKYLKGL